MSIGYKNVYNRLKLFPYINVSEIYNFFVMNISSLTNKLYTIDVTGLMEVMHNEGRVFSFHQV
jgi:hypothetical protein